MRKEEEDKTTKNVKVELQEVVHCDSLWCSSNSK